METLLDLARTLASDQFGEQGLAEVRNIEQEFVEVVTFAPADEIVAVLHTVIDENWIGLPVWARNLAYRIACLQRPDDVALLREAATDLRNFGPDWNDIASAMKERAESLEKNQD
ncbi:hypothetical protein [Micromonospora sp. CB01531]|uniref:hypothetical protein n=1 Tax=Micromonospora sp. CB01531 TaxID=1718947 RepID=UPI00093AB851|nr:hypothetical protein [Micromonospora sp. CB01531]OKI84561.1 hypothetical protein A6A27_40365 [Micromonospora sp. CB01531]